MTAQKRSTPASATQKSAWSLGGVPAHLFAQRRRIATVAASLLAVGVGYHVVFGHNGLTAFQAKRAETQSLEWQMQGLTRENDNLKAHVERLQTDPDTIEHQAREELRYARPGEVIVSLPADATPRRSGSRP